MNNIEPIKFGAIGVRNLFDDDETCFGEHTDDFCKIEYNDKQIIIDGEFGKLNISKRNYDKIKKISKGHQLEKYLPVSMNFDDDRKKLIINLDSKAVPLSKINNLEQKHANWILSRMIEFSAMLSKFDYVHLGINPDSIYVIPETHGIIPITFYFMKKLGDSINNEISSKYYLYYPSNVVSNNRASYFIDFELCKRTIASCMDVSLSPKLKEKYNSDFVDFLLTFDKETPPEVFKKYRNILEKNFEKKFYKFEV